VAPRRPPFARLDVSESDVQCCSLPNGLACPAAGLPASDGSGGAKPPVAGPFLAAAPRRARIARHASSPASSAAATRAAITMPAQAAPRSALSTAHGAERGLRLTMRERDAVSSALTACAARWPCMPACPAHARRPRRGNAQSRGGRPSHAPAMAPPLRPWPPPLALAGSAAALSGADGSSWPRSPAGALAHLGTTRCAPSAMGPPPPARTSRVNAIAVTVLGTMHT